MKWFGEPWPSAATPAPVCEDPADRVPVPVGELCMWCEEPVAEDDQGVTMPFLTVEGAPAQAVTHIECQMRLVIGSLAHMDGRCSCVGGTDHETPGLTMRQEAAEVYRRVQGGGLGRSPA